MEDWSGVMGGCDLILWLEDTVLGVRGSRPRQWSDSGGEAWVMANLLVSRALASLEDTMDSLAWFSLMPSLWKVAESPHCMLLTSG